jgi:N-acetylglutamate synthase-like GNAT family acetyltransferase
VSIRVREARDDDGGGLITLINACWSDYPGCVLDVDGELPELRTIASHFGAIGGHFWVAEREGAIVGCVGAAPTEAADGFELCKLYVAHGDRRVGLGRELVRLVEDEAVAAGSLSVELWSDTRFAEAHRFYERLGYVRLAQIRTLGDLSNTVEYRYRKVFYLNVNVT